MTLLEWDVALCMCVSVCSEEPKPVNPELLINVTCVTPVDKHQSKLSVWISWKLPAISVDRRHWHSVIEVTNDRRSRLAFIDETDADYKRLDLPVNQLYDIRVPHRTAPPSLPIDCLDQGRRFL